MTKEITLINAQQLHRENKKTFWAPSPIQLRRLREGDCVKVIAPLPDRGPRFPTAERFWVILRKPVGNGVWTGEVNNHLVSVKGIKAGDEISLHTDNVTDIWRFNQSKGARV